MFKLALIDWGPTVLLLLALVAAVACIAGCQYAEETGKALSHPEAVDLAIATGEPAVIDGVPISDEATATAIAIREAADKASKDPTIPGLIIALSTALAGGGGWWLRRKLKKPKPTEAG